MQNVCLHQAGSSDWPTMAELLTSAGLPLEGAQAHLAEFLLAFRAGRIIGMVGLERYGDAALLRSLVVIPSEQGNGLGRELVRHLLDRRFGFTRVTGSDIPAAVMVSAEFQGACPSSAVAMRLDLSRPPVTVRPAVSADVPAITPPGTR